MPRGRGGRRGGSRGRGRGGRGRGGDGSQQHRRSYVDNRVPYDQVSKHNEKYEKYYNTLNIVPEGPERDAFWEALRRELPNSWRFCGSKGHALAVRKNLVERYFPIIQGVKHEGREVELPKEIPWYPDGLAYDMKTPKNVVRKYEQFKEFQKFLVSETGVGNISRQEQVSMIPPFLLDVQPHHTCLDLCAAPGSKSAQLIELIHAGEEGRVENAIRAQGKVPDGIDGKSFNTYDGGRSTGLLIANDANYSRAQMLVHQVKRLNSANLIVTNHDATMFPSIQLPSEANTGSKGKVGPVEKWLKFDRILADVPCSGDGTLRKNPVIWKDWTPVNALGLYITQVRILVRALQMLKVGGRVVYSTCSLNPVENEAVVSSAIERCGGVGKVKLVDTVEALPGLRSNPGLEEWSVMARNGDIYESWEEAVQFVDDASRIVPGMFPPEPREDIPLHRCMRVYPHQQDTGGFFIAVLEKRSEIKAKAEEKSKCADRSWRNKPTIGDIVNEIETAPLDSTGHPEHLKSMEAMSASQAPEVLNGSIGPSAAQREHDKDVVPGGLKRKRNDDNPSQDDSGSKRQELEVDATETMLQDEAMIAERTPIPPAVAMAIESSGANPPTAEPTGDREPVGLPDTDADKPLNPDILVAPKPKTKRDRNEPVNQEAFKYLDPEHPELQSIYQFYELNEKFPRDRFLVRNPAGDPVKGIYYSTALAKGILQANEGRGIKFVHAGVKMFMKQDAQGQDICRWRIQTDGLPIIEGWVGDGRVINLWRKSTLRKLLVEMFPKLGPKDAEEGGWRDLGEVGPQVVDFSMGCCVLRVLARGDPAIPSDEQEEGFEERLTLPMWRSISSVNLMLPKEERKAMLLRIYNAEEPLINRSDPVQMNAASNGHAQGRSNGNKSPGPVQDNSEQVAETIADAGDDESETDKVAAFDGPDVDDNLAAEAQEQEDLAKQDRFEAEKMEVLENEDVKMAQVAPERVGEGDEMNTTV